MLTIVRARVMHTPRDPFREDGALEVFDDGAVAFDDGRILTTGSFAGVRREHPDAAGSATRSRRASRAPAPRRCSKRAQRFPAT